MSQRKEQISLDKCTKESNEMLTRCFSILSTRHLSQDGCTFMGMGNCYEFPWKNGIACNKISGAFHTIFCYLVRLFIHSDRHNLRARIPKRQGTINSFRAKTRNEICDANLYSYLNYPLKNVPTNLRKVRSKVTHQGYFALSCEKATFFERSMHES